MFALPMPMFTEARCVKVHIPSAIGHVCRGLLGGGGQPMYGWP